MLLLVVVQVEAIMISRDWDLVEEELEVRIVVLRVEEFFECYILHLRKSHEPIHEKPNVSIARSLGIEGIGAANLELPGLSNLGIPCSKSDGLLHLHRNSTRLSLWKKLLLKINNLYKKKVSC